MTYDATIALELVKGLAYTVLAVGCGIGFGTLCVWLLPKGDEP